MKSQPAATGRDFFSTRPLREPASRRQQHHFSNPAPFHSPRVPIWKGLRSGGSSAITPIVSTFASRATTIERQCSHTAKTAMDDWNFTGAPHWGQS